MFQFSWRVGIPVLLGTLIAASANASPIFVNNFSFETLPASGLPFACGVGCSFSIGPIAGWVNAGGGQFQPGAPANTNDFNSVPDGTTVAFLNGGTITQTVVPTVQAGVTYTLMVDLGVRKCFVDPGSIALVVNGNVYSGAGILPSSGNWSTFTATYTGLLADVGQAITIQLASPGIQGEFDNVRLSDNAGPVPEPATSALIGLGVVAIGLFSRRKKV